VKNKLVASVSIDSEGKKITNYYEYVYNNDSLPISGKIHRVQSIIEKDKIRHYWE